MNQNCSKYENTQYPVKYDVTSKCFLKIRQNTEKKRWRISYFLLEKNEWKTRINSLFKVIEYWSQNMTFNIIEIVKLYYDEI